MADEPSDLRLTSDGEWEPDRALPDIGEKEFLDAALERNGWAPLIHLGGGEDMGVEVTLHQQRASTGHPEYLLSVSGPEFGSPALRLPNLPEAMRLLAQWAPIVQAASITHILGDLIPGEIKHYGLVETIAARAAWGVAEKRPELQADRRMQDRVEEARYRAARKP
ncbi:hypothetical protein BS329_15380 [Amycolatopsis coloradensis]|uniref:Uncharacterized protein n=2 Tax=Amycolatopsis coloradensis TaxID=76021 RepID=A0A1R0KUE8_9PSEU|nr:hypothetical protein BS329_15380 [Amycolatopsis coloradensis]